MDDFFMLRALAPTMGFMLLGSSLGWLGLLYVIARWRNNRAAVADPQLGLKFALQAFRFFGYQLLLGGGFAVVYAILHKGGGRTDIIRPAFGLLVVGGLVFGVHTLLLTKTNQDSFTLVARLFGGLNLLLTGMIGFVALVIAFQMLFQKGEHGDDARMVWSLVLTYVTAWALQGAMLGKSMLEGPAPDESLGRSGGAPPPLPAASVPEPMRTPLA